MNEAEPVGEREPRALRPVFVSYATADRKLALSACKALERRGIKCWISTRDVEPGENYQEAIVQAIRTARAVVLVFSEAANHSQEIKKELSLASRFDVPVMALRIADVEPSDAFAYELSTRQWIDAFDGWDKSIDALANRIAQVSPAGRDAPLPTAERPRRRQPFADRRIIWVAAAVLFTMLVAAGAWLAMRPSPRADRSMQIRLTGFQLLSADLPATMRDAISNEIIAAFNEDGVVGVSTASAPAPGSAPAYAFGGTVQRDGVAIRVITRLTNERSGATLWSNTFDYTEEPAAKIPRRIAVDAGNVIRCGLFGASTYDKPLPDPILKDYMQFCQGHWDPNLADGRKALVPAQRVVAAAPDFSWGWAAVAGGFWKVAQSAEDEGLAAQARRSGVDAADRAVALDGKNSEALWLKARLIDRHDWIGQERLFKRAIAARSLDCGCEHHQYGEMLLDVGRVADAVEQLRQAEDLLALYVYTSLSLANALVAAGKPDEAKPVFGAAVDLAPNSKFANWITVTEATETGDVAALADPNLQIPAELRSALLAGFRAKASEDAAAKARAVRILLALPEDRQNPRVAKLLADLGAEHEAFLIARRMVMDGVPPSIFWYPNMRGTLDDPGFPAVAQQLGLVDYWRKSHTKPDACLSKGAPAFCGMI